LNRTGNRALIGDKWLGILLGTLCLVGLYVVSRQSFLVFHCLAEAFAIVIAIAVFAIFWNSRLLLDNGFFLVVGLGCPFAGILDLVYIFAYRGMSVFPGTYGNVALQAKTVAQWYVSLSCVAAFAFLRRRVRQNLALLVYSALLALALAAIFSWRIFPVCLTESGRITAFARLGLAVSCTAYLAALALLVVNRTEFDGRVFQFLAAVLTAFFVQDFLCAVAVELEGFARTAAHLCQVVALCFVYKAFVEVGLRKPYELLFRRQQQSAAALEREQQFLEAVLDNAQCGIAACDADGVMTLLNRATQEWLGRPQARIPAQQWAEHYGLYHSDEKTRMKMEEVPLYRALRGEHIHDVEMTIVSKAGPPRDFVVSGAPLTGKDGENRGAVVSMHDVTQRKRAEQALALAAHEWSATFDAMADGVSVHALDRTIVAINQSLCEMLGKSKDELIGTTCYQAFHGSCIPVSGCPVENCRRTLCKQTAEIFEPVLQRWLAVSASPIFDDEGRAVRFVHTVRDVTQRKRAETALRQNEEGLRLVLEAPAIGWWRLDMVHGTLVADQRTKDLFAVPGTAEPSFALFLERIFPEDRALAQRHYAEALVCPGDYQGEYRTTWPDGSQHWLFLRGRSFHDGPGKPARMDGIAMDITDRKQAEAALLESISRLHATLESTAEGILVVDLEGRVVDFNERFLALWRLPQDFVPAGRKRDLVGSPGDHQAMQFALEQLKDPQGFVAKVQALYAAPEASSFDVLEWKDGRIFERYSQPQRIDGRPVGRVWSFRDVTDRKAAEQALRESESRYRLLVETIPQLAWRSSVGGGDIECNRRWYEYTGQTPESVRYFGWLAAVHPDDLFGAVERILHATNQQEPYELEYRLRRASDNSYRWHLSRGVPLKDQHGQVTDWFGCATDIEDLKQAQETLRQAHEAQLQRHRAELAHVSRLSTMGEMAANLAHELKQPLHAVNNYASGSLMRLLKAPQRDEPLVAALEQIGKEANRAAEIVRRVRGFVEKREPQLAEVSLNALVEEVVLLSKAELEQRHVQVALDLAETLPTVIGDAVQIEQVVMNLLRNGLEAMEDTPEESRRLVIKTAWLGNEMIHAEVSDCGKGIGPENLEKVFEPFFTTRPEGMGMGLSISRSIVQAHGGRLWFSANPGQGCTFHFILPIGKRT
jgi:PAS domain S-box-containing protein